MSQRAHPVSILLIDACTVINLVACRHPDAVLSGRPETAAIVPLVSRETLYVRRGGSGDDADERERIDLGPLLNSGHLSIIEPDETELEAFIDLTQALDDGEAMTVAVALRRGYAVATDDRQVRRFVARDVPLISTLDLIKSWADRERVARQLLQRMLLDLHDRGSYVPGRRHPLRGWWDDILAGEG